MTQNTSISRKGFILFYIHKNGQKKCVSCAGRNESVVNNSKRKYIHSLFFSIVHNKNIQNTAKTLKRNLSTEFYSDQIIT